MIAIAFARTARAVMVVLAATAFVAPAQAQAPAPAQEPSPAALALARELLEVKGARSMFEPVLLGVIEQAKGVFLQTNPALSKDLDQVAGQLRTEYAPRTVEITNDVARLYALHFTEQELKEAVAFFKTSLGKKIITEEPKVLDESFARVRQWANRFSEEVVTKLRVEMRKKGHNL